VLSKIASCIFKNMKVVGEAVLVKTSAFNGSVAPYQVEVMGSDNKEFRLRVVTSKGSKPVVVRLDRNITQNVELITEKGFFSTPLRIASLSVDEKGGVKGTLESTAQKK